jgi:tRNA(fMet)-specific endonuclease VapC
LKFESTCKIFSIFPALDIYAKEKARLKFNGTLVDDFDLLIGATAIQNNMIFVTRTISDFNRLTDIQINDWTSEL